jgi:predicted phage terminase large subunit-like protein
MIYYDNKEFESERLYELYILNKFLAKYYGEKNALKFMKASVNDIDKLAKDLGSRDITFFCLYFLSDMFIVKDDNTARTLSPSHYDMWNLLNETFVEDKHDKINIVVSRGFAKTTVCDTALGIWLHCYKKSRFTLLIGKKEDDAVSFMDTIKKVFNEDEKIIKNFGKLIDKRLKLNATEIEFTNGTYIRAIGSGTSCRGLKYGKYRPSTVIADDAQSENDVITDEAREKKYDKWCKEVEEVGDKAVYRNGKKIKSATKIISIGTVLHNDCLISRLARNNDYFTFLRRAIILKPKQTVDDIFESKLWLQCKKLYFNDRDKDSKNTAKQFYEKNKEKMKFPVLWEEKWDCFTDLAIKYWENRMSFMSELMNDASNIGVKWFKTVIEEDEEYLNSLKYQKTMLCVDPASTTTKKSDYTAMVVGSKTGDYTYIRDIVMRRLEFKEYVQTVCDLLEKYPEIQTIYIEKQTYSGSDVLAIKELIEKNPKLRHRRFDFVNEMQRKNKDEKISTIMDKVNNGLIRFNKECEDSKEAFKQMKEFQGQSYSRHDDFVDITAECDIRLKNLKSGRVTLLSRSCLF